MDLDSITILIRKLAKSNYYQSLFAYSKQDLNIQIFRNRTDLTNLQLIFLTYLSFYHELESDIYTGEVDDRVLEDFIYEDAYMEYRNEQRNKTNKESSTHPYLREKEDKSKDQKQESVRWVFTGKK